MNFLRIYLILHILSFSKSYAQQIQWLNQQTGVYNQHATGNRIATNSSGESHTIATYSGQATVGSNSFVANGSQGAYLTKFDSSGTLIWLRKINSSDFSSGEAISVDKQNNVYATGRHGSNTTFETTTITPTNSMSAIYIAKYGSSGNLLWVNSYSSAFNTTPLSIKNDSLSNTYITGRLSGQVVFGSTTLTANTQNAFILKLDSQGNVIWATQFGGNTQVNAYDLAIDNNLSVHVIGHFGNVGNGGNQNIVIGTTTLVANLKTPDIFLAKFNSNGIAQYAKKMGGAFSGDRGLGIDYDGMNHIYLSGALEGSAVFDSYTVNATPPTAGKYAGYVAKYDLNGNCKWAKTTDTLITSQFWDVHCSDRNSIYIGGEVMTSALFKLDSLGNEKWHFTTNSTGSGSGYSISSNKNGQVYMFSTYSGPLSTPLGTLSTGSYSILNNFITRIDSEQVLILGLNELINIKLKVYPNPVHDMIHIDFNQANHTLSNIEIYNNFGSLVCQQNFAETINVQNLAKGLYLLVITNSNRQAFRIKFIKV